MTRFQPFLGIRYHSAEGLRTDISSVLAPPYDVLNDQQRRALEEQHPANSVQIDFPRGKEDPGAYAQARVLLDRWLADGTLRKDSAPTFTVYRMTDPHSGHVTTGVLGALGLEHPGEGDVLPHEETTPKDKADRLSLISACEINTSPIWVLSTVPGLGALCSEITNRRPPDAVAVDEAGVSHEVWVVADSTSIRAIQDKITGGPVVVADGHHRLETALKYEQTRSEANGIMAFVVELSADELEVRPIHRIVTAPDPAKIREHLAKYFNFAEISEPADGPTLIDAAGVQTRLVPILGAFADNISLDSQRVRIALADVEGHEFTYHHDAETVARGAKEKGGFAVLLRPATVAQIRAVADSRTRMPPKTTFFYPKPRTGLVFRPVV